MATGRVNRYPSKMQGGFSWTGIIADTNSCNVDNWWYRLAEEERPEGYDFFAQPPALLVEKDAEGKLQYRENPEAENIENHTAGYGYYFLQLPGKHTEWVNVYVMNRYGSSNPGNLVYPEYGDGNLTGVSFDPGETSYGPTTSTSRRFPP